MPRKKRRRTLPWWTYLWPGLPHLWLRGSLAGMTLAVAFSVLLNVLILATLVWPAWLDSRLRFGCAACVLGLWIAALVETRAELRRLAKQRELLETTSQDPPPEEVSPNDTRIRTAQHEYLRGDLVAASRRLRQAVRADRRDIEARLWYAMSLRRSGRLNSAARQLNRLERLDDAARWRDEIAREHKAIERLRQPQTHEQQETTETHAPGESPTEDRLAA